MSATRKLSCPALPAGQDITASLPPPYFALVTPTRARGLHPAAGQPSAMHAVAYSQQMQFAAEVHWNGQPRSAGPQPVADVTFRSDVPHGPTPWMRVARW